MTGTPPSALSALKHARAIFTLPTLAVMLCAVHLPARAQLESQATPLDPSIESAGMGGGSVAVFWRKEPNDWANPASMGTHEGIRYSHGWTRLLEDLTDDVDFTSHRILLGAWGVGLAMTGKPIDSVGRMRVDYGRSEATDVDGNVIGTFNAHEDVRSLALGVSILDLFSRGMEALGGNPIGLRRRVTIAVGHTWKDIETDWGTNILGGPRYGKGDDKDRGALLRVALLDRIGADLGASVDSRFRIELAGGYSELNYEEDYEEINEIDPLFSQRKYGASSRFTMALPTSGTGWIWNWASPTVGLGLAWETTEDYVGDVTLQGNAVRVGAELVIADVLSLRHGQVDDDRAYTDGAAWGAGLAIEYRKLAGVRLDWARYPASDFLRSDPDRYGITASVDPYRLWQELK